MGPVKLVDLNGDGYPDLVDQGRVTPKNTKTDDHSCDGGMQFVVNPQLQNKADPNHPIKMNPAPVGLKRFHDGMMDFALADPNLPVFQPGGLLSVHKGQLLGEVDASNNVIKSFRADGLAMGITRYQLDKLYRGTYEKQVEHGDLTWRAYTLGSERVKDEINLKNAVWILEDSLQPINPNTILTNASPSDAEKLLFSLFKEVSDLKAGAKTINPESIKIKLGQAVARWQVKAFKENSTLAKQITQDPLWTGIQQALAKCAGLSPVDFPG